MVNTKLVMQLENLFKQEPFNLENTKISIEASYGSIKVNPDEDYIEQLEDEVSMLQASLKSYQESQNEHDEEIEYYKALLDDNDIEYSEY